MVGFQLRDVMTLGPNFDRVIAAAREGEEWALRAVYEELAPQVRGYLQAEAVADVDEVLGEVFLQVVRDFASFRGEDERALRAWVLSIAHRRLAEEQPRRSRRLSISIVREPKDSRSPEWEAPAPTSREDRIDAVLSDLSPNQRSVVLLRALGDLSIEQVADVIGKSPRTVARLQRRGLAALARGEARNSEDEEPADIRDARGWASDTGTDEKARPVSERLDSLAEDARRLRRDSDLLIRGLEEVIASLEGDPPSPPVEPDEAPRIAGPQRQQEGGVAQPSMLRRAGPEMGRGREEALLRATQMAIRGRSRAEIEAVLSEEFGIANPGEVADQILGPDQPESG